MLEPSRKIFELRLLDLHPSQLYISSCKLRAVDYLFCCGGASMLQPLPVIKLDQEWVLTDGHTRALALYLKGYQNVKVFEDPDPIDLDMYRTAVHWCRTEGIKTIADLAPRLVEHSEFERLWIQRCQDQCERCRSQAETKQTTGQNKIPSSQNH